MEEWTGNNNDVERTLHPARAKSALAAPYVRRPTSGGNSGKKASRTPGYVQWVVSGSTTANARWIWVVKGMKAEKDDG
jgi:hypothetical protein